MSEDVRLTINLLGNIGIYYDGEDITTKLSSKSIAIIMYLVNSAPKKITREKISDLLWNEKYENSGYNLRYNLWSIKKHIPADENGNELIISNKEYCYINSDYRYVSDIESFKKLDLKNVDILEFKELQSIRQSYKGEFLEHFHIKDSEEFYEWILLNRVKFQKQYVHCLNRIYNIIENSGKYDEITELLEEILENNPYDEEIHYNLMKVYIKSGKRHQAIAQYKKCDNILRTELNIGAKNKLKELYIQLISEDEKAGYGTNKKTIEIIVNKFSSRNIEYLAISQLIEQIIDYSKNSGQNIVNQKIKRIFSAIIPSLDDDEPEVQPREGIKDINIYIAVREALLRMNKSCNLKLVILNREKMDHKSKCFFEYMDGNIKSFDGTIEYKKR